MTLRSARARGGLLLLILVLGTGSGCGTVLDGILPHEDGPRVYGGIKFDVRYAMPREIYWWPFYLIFAAIDMPLSAVADTLFLPYTLSRASNHPDH